MPVTVTWFDEAQTILLISGTKITAAELSAATPEISQIQQSVPHPIGIIQDMRHLSLVDRERPTAMPGISQIGGSMMRMPVSPDSARVAVLAFVYQADMVDSLNQMYSQMLTLMARTMPESSGIPVRAFASVGAAADFIADVLTQRL